MSFPGLTPEIAEPNSDDIFRYLRANRLPRTSINIAAATNSIRQQRINDALPKGREITFTDSNAPRQIVFGRCKVPGVIVFGSNEADNSAAHLIIALAGHEIQDIDAIYLDGARVDFPAVPGVSSAIVPETGPPIFTDGIYLEKRFGTDNQAAQTYITSRLVGWSGLHVLYGIANVGLSFTWNPTLYGDTFPDISFLLRGMKVYDPRNDTTGYSNNCALVIAAFLMNSRFGLGYSSSEIDMDSLEEAADICEEIVSGEYRYVVNGYFLSSETPETILENLVESFQGRILFNYSGRKWQFKPAKYYTPSLTITLDDVLSEIKLVTNDDRAETFNGVQGTYIDPDNNYEENDFPIVKNITYANQDGGQKNVDVKFPLITSPITAQRLSKIKLERSRQGLTVSFTTRIKAIVLVPGDNIFLTIPKYGWTNKVFEVQEAEILENGSAPNNVLVVGLVLRENATGIYEWANGEETTVDLAPNTNLPSAFQVPVIVGATAESGTNHLFINGDGTVVTRVYVSWTQITDNLVSSGGKIEWQFKLSADSAWTQGTSLIGDLNSFYINNLKDGSSYDIRIRAINALRAEGAWTTILAHVVVGKTAPPSNVSILNAAVSDYGISLSWPKIPDADLGPYEIRLGATWDGASLIAQTKTTSYLIGLRVAAAYTFLIKAIDTTGNYSSNATARAITITAPSVSGFTSVIEGENVSLSWTGVKGSFAILSYYIYSGLTFGSAVLIANLKSTSFKKKVDWTGNTTFWIVAQDAEGNNGAQISNIVTILIPDRVTSISGEVVDNNVLLRWGPSNSSALPITSYNLYKGNAENALTSIGSSSGTFSVVFETSSGTYTYWVSPVDSAGNQGLKRSTTQVVDEPPDFILRLNQQLDPDLATTFDNMIEEGEFIRPGGAGFFDPYDLGFG